mmetsp:Transcript_37730/g.49688  ORF Transcript_37730/g.49688 Transcript_37730/m.49688 type:complete len:488 (+) Transcript_37730:226-1689(+)|eukprot:CAMPEP_0117754424 /NCGR_PEP_ID=MMETSP0947-20121206/12824_1 /TAXON_ID=44440 /ORGANISM="Chattonella subsalsa, Strain CCMP2191" /LENGTH=487 /DNA_ID=CAMNT_0005573517 /DNA_START=209 /DNA_END=1672 /DNA_ORIENTATION=-
MASFYPGSKNTITLKESMIFTEEVLLFLSFPDLLSVREVNKMCHLIFKTNTQFEAQAKRLLRKLYSTNLLVNAVAVQNDSTDENRSPTKKSTSNNCGKPLSIAHKGITEENGEGNTISAIQEAIRIGVDMIELDLISCQTGNIIVFHDPYLPGGELVSETPISFIKSKYPQIPTLREVMQATAKSSMKLYFDLKSPDLVTPLMNEILITVERKKCNSNKYLVASFDHHDLLEVESFRATYSELEGVETIVIVDSMPIGLSKPFEGLGAKYIAIAQGRITRAFVKDAHLRKMGVLAWTVNNSNLISHFLKIGVDGIVTDLPGSLMRLIKQHSAPGIDSEVQREQQENGKSKEATKMKTACNAELFLESLYPEGLLPLRKMALEALTEIEPLLHLATCTDSEVACSFTEVFSCSSELLKKIAHMAKIVKTTMNHTLHPHLLSDKTFHQVFTAMASHPEEILSVHKSVCSKRFFDFESNWLKSVACGPSS